MNRAFMVSTVVVMAWWVAACGGGADLANADLEVSGGTCPVDEEVAEAFGETELLGRQKLDDASDEPSESLDLDEALERRNGAYATCDYLYLDNDEDFTVHVVRLEGSDSDALAPAIEELALPATDYQAEEASGFLSDDPEPPDANDVLADLADSDPGTAVNVAETSLSLARIDAGEDVFAVVFVSMSDDVDDREALVEGIATRLAD